MRTAQKERNDDNQTYLLIENHGLDHGDDLAYIAAALRLFNVSQKRPIL